MAYAAFDSLRQTIEKITMDKNQYSISLHQEELFRSIHEQVIFLQEFADEFPGDMAEFSGRELRHIVYEAKDVIERFISESGKIYWGFRSNKRVSFVIVPNCFKRKINFNEQLESIRKDIDSIASYCMERVKVCNTVKSDVQIEDSRVAPTSKINNVVGLDDDLVAIKSRLCGGSLKLQVIPIVGMGGIGKSTLSGIAYDDPLTTQYFDVRCWVMVSQDYCIQEIVASLVNSLKEFSTKKFEQSNEETVRKSLKGRRYLIVMDDMWSSNAWDDLASMFPDDHNGSRLMLTTRLLHVAAYCAGHSPLHEMRFMSVEQSWELLRQRVFADRGCSKELEKIGKKIAERCRGLPLAVVVTAGLLSKVEKKPHSWQIIADNVSSIVVTKEGQFEEIISLSYTHLPHHLKPCFLYMGGFPEDHEIRVSKLVKLWVAEGFLSHTEGSSKSLEEEARECLEDLVSRSLVLVTKRKCNGRIKSCSLHDLIRDLCIRKAQESNFFLNIMERYVEKQHFMESITDQNRVSVKPYSLSHFSSTHHSTIHTIMCFPTTNTEKHRPLRLECLKSVEMLRVLDAENFGVQSLPGELFNLFQLRYLAVGCFTVPSGISRLHNLETLVLDARYRRKLTGRPIVGSLPPEIWTMTQLRHVVCHSSLPNPKKKDPLLENLQTLSLVLNLNDKCFEGILEKIPNIRKLGIDCSSYVSGTHLNNLACQHQLESLKLCNGRWRKDSISFPRVVRKLSLWNMCLPWSEMSVVGSLPNLQVLKLRDLACTGSTWETSHGEFLQLQFLLLETSKLQHWITETNHFPRLKFLLLHDCWCLTEIPESIGEITTLELIHVRGHARPVLKSLAESAQSIQEEQRGWGNDALQVRCPLPESCVNNDWLSDEVLDTFAHDHFF